MVSYMSVHITPEKYSGRHTDQSQEPLMADQPSSTPQLNVSPERNKNKANQAEWSPVDGINDRKTKWVFLYGSIYPTQAVASRWSSSSTGRWKQDITKQHPELCCKEQINFDCVFEKKKKKKVVL